jgi:hypothetical protein
MEPVANANATMHASAIMKIVLRFGFATPVSSKRKANSLGYAKRDSPPPDQSPCP